MKDEEGVWEPFRLPGLNFYFFLNQQKPIKIR